MRWASPRRGLAIDRRDAPVGGVGKGSWGGPGSPSSVTVAVARSAQPPRSVVQAATQSSWSLHVVAASSSAQSACGVAQYQILS